MLLNAGLWLIAINLATYAAFAIDKRAAINHEPRIREDTLLFLALIGGSPGALLARVRLRHKTRKEPFRTILLLIVGMQIGGLILFAVWAVLTFL